MPRQRLKNYWQEVTREAGFHRLTLTMDRPFRSAVSERQIYRGLPPSPSHILYDKIIDNAICLPSLDGAPAFDAG
ncbi:hypothetical protein MRB53_040494 [Persea americana]|nr:hypothetical protein MRB53_040494 [Persea americana]